MPEFQTATSGYRDAGAPTAQVPFAGRLVERLDRLEKNLTELLGAAGGIEDKIIGGVPRGALAGSKDNPPREYGGWLGELEARVERLDVLAVDASQRLHRVYTAF